MAASATSIARAFGFGVDAVTISGRGGDRASARSSRSPAFRRNLAALLRRRGGARRPRGDAADQPGERPQALSRPDRHRRSSSARPSAPVAEGRRGQHHRRRRRGDRRAARSAASRACRSSSAKAPTSGSRSSPPCSTRSAELRPQDRGRRAGRFDRRWNLKMKSGVDVKLPEADPLSAMATLVRLQRQSRILDRDILSASTCARRPRLRPAVRRGRRGARRDARRQERRRAMISSR